MDNALLLHGGLFLAEMGSIFWLSRQTVNELFFFLRTFIHQERVVFSLVSLLFFPGTILHEMAHFITALALMLRVREITIFPKFHANYIKLGSVVYEKQDFVRGVLVGIAPIFAGLFFFWFVARFNLFPSDTLWLNMLITYLIFTISSTMFSSKQDLVDVVFILPLFLLIGGVVYIFNINLSFITHNGVVVDGLTSFLKEVNIYLGFSLIMNIGLLAVLKMMRQLMKK
ncbi:hypothetical protein HY214_02570 [Candidatus Roizmanbacteria bacterium]|nr:hypothetical protein [Candidatus Roizmanbacteria bacterium]